MMSTQRIALAFILASLLTGCGMFGGPAQTERDTDAVQRAEDPYHTDPKYNAWAATIRKRRRVRRAACP